MAVKDPTINEIAALLGAGRDPATGLAYVPDGTDPWYESLTSAIYHLTRSAAGWLRVAPDDSAATTVRILPGRAMIDGTPLAYAGGIADLSAYNNDTAVVWAYDNAGVIAIGSGATGDGWPAIPHLKLAEVTFASGALTVLLDRRAESIVTPAAAGQRRTVTANTAGATLTRGQAGSVQSNLGASGAVTLVLPQTARSGDWFDFFVATGQSLRIDPGAAGAVYVNGAKQTDDKYVACATIGGSLRLVADGNGDWLALGVVATWTVES